MSRIPASTPVKPAPTPRDTAAAAPIQVAIVSDYLSHSRFSKEGAAEETLLAVKDPQPPASPPSVRLDYRITYQALSLADHYAITLTVTVSAEAEQRTLYHVEVSHVGIFLVKCEAPEQQPAQWREQLINGYCPNLLYPFARQQIQELVARSGSPAIQLPVMNFEREYQRQRQAQTASVNTER